MHREEQHSWSHNHTIVGGGASHTANNNNNKRKHDVLDNEPSVTVTGAGNTGPGTGVQTPVAGVGVVAGAGAGVGTDGVNSDDKRGRNTIVIHPGSRWLRIGRASDILPVSVPHVIARWAKHPDPKRQVFRCGVRRPTPLRPDELDEEVELEEEAEEDTQAEREGEEEEDGAGGDKMEQDEGIGKGKVGEGDDADADTDAEVELGLEPEAETGPEEKKEGEEEGDKIDEGTARIDGLRVAFKDRLKSYQFRYQKGAAESAVNFNRVQTKKKFGGAETIADHNDLQRITWITSTTSTGNGSEAKKAYFGHDVFLLSDSVRKEFEIRWPLRGMRFNCDKREEVQGVLNDLVDIWTAALVNELEIKRSQFKESVCATYGAQLSNACVVDIGAAKTSICCVEDGLILPDTRITLNVAGDDITEAYYVLLQRSCFPYKEMDLTRLYDWNLLQDLKHSTCTFDLQDISGARWFNVIVRRPETPTLKYHFKMYDEYMTAPLVLTETSAIWFAEKRKRWTPVWNSDVQEDLSNAPVEEITYAMKLSTDHILKDIAAETAAALAKQAAMDVDSKENTSDNPKPRILDIPSRKRVVKSYRTESPPLVLPEDMIFPGGLPIDIPFETSKLPLDVAIFNSTRAASEAATLPVVTKFLQNTLLVG
ncbi:actin-like protein arp8, partial [Serendipita sp. 411]